MALYNNTCEECGWSSGPTNRKYTCLNTCPVCGKRSVSSAQISESGSNDTDSYNGFPLLLLIVGVILCLCSVLVFFPGLMFMMFLDKWVHYESTFWIWVSAILYSGIVFLFCGFNWKKYLVVDGIFILFILLLSLFIDSFSPFSWATNILFG